MICAAAFLGVPTIASAQASGALPMLLSSPIAPAVTKAASNSQGADRSVTRQRRVAINFHHLDPQSGNVPPEMGVELFDGQVVTLELNHIERRGSGNYTWVGRSRDTNGARQS